MPERLSSSRLVRELRRRAHTTQAVIARIELGLARPTADMLTRLARAAGFDLEVSVVPRPILDRHLLDDVQRILALSPEDRLREVANLNRFAAMAVRRA